MNGTYVCASKYGPIRGALTLIVMEVTFLGQYMTINLTCLQNTVSAGPPFYEPEFNTSWLYSTTWEYTVHKYGANLIVKNLDCNIKFSRPVFCALTEGIGEWSPHAYLHPHTLFLGAFKPTEAQSFRTNNNTSTQTVAIVIGCLTKKGDVVTKHVEENIVEPREPDISDDNLQLIFNIISDTPTNTPQQVRREVTGIENPVAEMRREVTGIRNHVSETFNSDSSDIGNNTNTEEALEARNEATEINQSLLELELESCLQNLSRKVSKTENPVQLRRSHIVEDMMNVYADPDILRCRLHVQLIGEQGSDFGGLSRDAFTTFWNEALSVFFKGDAVHIPYLPLVNMENENKFVILGRI